MNNPFNSTAVLATGALLCAVMATPIAYGHGAVNVTDKSPTANSRAIEFPDTKGRKTLVLDPHTHSVFSDGHVWPNIRVAEAQRDGLDAIAITEHLEWQPHRSEIPNKDRNAAYEEAVLAARDSDLLVISGSEITREYPAGHMNALFISDANTLLRDTLPLADEKKRNDPVLDYYTQAGQWPAREAVAAANAQNAFVFWNHPDWTAQRPNGVAVMDEFHSELISEELLHGIEVANGQTYSAEAFALALEYNLTLLGVSDVHDLIDWDHPPQNNEHRPVTLVLARSTDEAALQKALFERRTAVWFKNTLLGRPREVDALLNASLSLVDARYDKEVIVATLANASDADWQLRSTSGQTFLNDTNVITVPAHSKYKVAVKAGAGKTALVLDVEVLNALVAPDKSAVMRLRAKL